MAKSIIVECSQCGDDRFNIVVSEKGILAAFCVKNQHDAIGADVGPEFYDAVVEAGEDEEKEE